VPTTENPRAQGSILSVLAVVLHTICHDGHPDRVAVCMLEARPLIQAISFTFGEALQREAALRREGGTGGCDVQEPAEPVVLGLKEPGRVVKRVRPRGEQDRLDGGGGSGSS
jgi:hypothetical protein